MQRFLPLAPELQVACERPTPDMDNATRWRALWRGFVASLQQGLSCSPAAPAAVFSLAGRPEGGGAAAVRRGTVPIPNTHRTKLGDVLVCHRAHQGYWCIKG
eukprot:COSAG06_NODE_7410_length_2511_cov_3.126294_1_plen_102_part_00